MTNENPGPRVIRKYDGLPIVEIEVLADIPKNGHEIYRVRVVRIKGIDYADLRVWFVKSRDGDLHPGKGVVIKADALDDIVQALLEARSWIAPNEA